MPYLPYAECYRCRPGQHPGEFNLSDGREADSKGVLSPFRKQVGAGPSPANQPEQRTVVEIHKAEQAPSDVFHQEAPIPSRLLTPKAAGIVINTRPGESSDRHEVGADEHTVQSTSEQWWNQPR